MKKLIVLLLSLMLIMGFTACGSDSDNGGTDEPVTVERDLPEGDYSEMGAGTIYVVNAGGSSEDGNVPIMYVGEDVVLEQIGFEAWEFDGSLLSYIYIDGVEVEKEQLSDVQMSLDLEGAFLSEGVHDVEVVQYDNNEPSGTMVTYKKTSYEVKYE